MYLLHKKFAKDPQHYIRAFRILEQDLNELFNYVEPADKNLHTYSHRIQQLLMRTCVEIEANLTAILTENSYPKTSDLTMKDYRLVDQSHRLSSFDVRITTWSGSQKIRTPYAAWKNNGSLSWYRAYNKSKHNRHENFRLATFEALTDAICGLIALLSAQFYDEDYSTSDKSMGLGGGYSYDTDDGMQNSIGRLFRVKFPTDWPGDDRYDFDWGALKQKEDPFNEFEYTVTS